MRTIFKTLTGIIPSNQTAIVFTDSMILEDSILDVFFSNDDIVVDDMTMSGNSVTVTISPQNYNVGVALFINNCEVFTPYDDTEVLNRLTIVETDTDTLNTEIGVLDTEVSEINTELDTLTNTVNNKQDKLPDVVNDRYLHTNSVTGNLEWSTVQGGSGSVNVYSDEERVIGTWFGKTLYGKVVIRENIDLPSYSSPTINVDMGPDLGTNNVAIIKSSVVIGDSNSNQWATNPCLISHMIGSDEYKVRCLNSWGKAIGRYVYFILEYTKN